MSKPDAKPESGGDSPILVRSGGSGKPAATAYPGTVERLIEEFARLPGIGRRSAERLAFHVLKADKPEALALSRAIEDVKLRVRHCAVCFNLADAEGDADRGLCGICAAAAGAARARDAGLVMVVEQPKDLISLEQTGMYRGVYHVLMGRMSPMDGVGPGDLTVADLLRRIDEPGINCGGVAVREVILGLNPTLEADGTALYLAEELGKRAVKVTRLARGLPTGSQLEFANKAVLADAIEGRRPM
ncbi:MAG: recombination mediator RecR [Phycisphaeraceae bacterium]|nr:recombination mediator RecR [Phycisphaeraceae bacterium]